MLYNYSFGRLYNTAEVKSGLMKKRSQEFKKKSEDYDLS